MDPFSILPAEIRLEILTSTRSKRLIQQVIQASPTMLNQYVVHREYINKRILVAEEDFDDDMIRDAMAIILFPDRVSSGWPWRPYYDHWRSWLDREFPNPFKKESLTRKGHQSPTKEILVKEINKLYQKMLVFIEDYLTKATSACPSREYLCLPHPNGWLTFKDRTVCVRMDATQCKNIERRRLLKAFLKYEMICKFCYAGGVSLLPWQCYWFTQHLTWLEKEALSCVETYLRSLYKAVLAQCGDSNLPDSLPSILATIAPETKDDRDFEPLPFHPPYDMFYHLLSLNADELCRWLACCGFDLATAVVAGTTAGQHERAIVRQWCQDLAKRGPLCGFSRKIFSQYSTTFAESNTAGLITEVSDFIGDDKSCHEGPGLCQKLCTRFAAEAATYRLAWPRRLFEEKILKLYRSRAWVSFDDPRLFKVAGEGPHFPADDVTFHDIRFHDIIGRRHYYEGEDIFHQNLSPEIEIMNLSRAIAQAKSYKRNTSSTAVECRAGKGERNQIGIGDQSSH
ncbi:hypothetical protein F4777DRAFT_599204 [Nemania sp. FL0916]|nr:hypothetical protein F4777DRAFT_599204 [Nemania sp. FL0916]